MYVIVLKVNKNNVLLSVTSAGSWIFCSPPFCFNLSKMNIMGFELVFRQSLLPQALKLGMFHFTVYSLNLTVTGSRSQPCGPLCETDAVYYCISAQAVIDFGFLIIYVA